MAKGENTTAATGGKNLPQKTDTEKMVPNSSMLSGADDLTFNETCIGVSINLKSSGIPSSLVIPDVSGVKDGKPVFITKRLVLDGKNFKKFLTAKGLIKEDQKDEGGNPLINLIGDTSISCEAFYYSKSGPMLMIFEVNIGEGLIKNLTGDEDLGNLFDITGANLRVLRITKPEDIEILDQYVARLTE